MTKSLLERNSKLLTVLLVGNLSMAEPWEDAEITRHAWQNAPLVKKVGFSQDPVKFPPLPKRSWRVEKMAKEVQLTPEETAQDVASEQTSSSFAELQKELKAAVTPVQKRTLQAEYDRLAPFFKVLGK